MPQPPAHPLRTLPFHLTLQMLLWGSSNAALLPQKGASQNWSAKWPDFAANWLNANTTAFHQDTFHQAAFHQAVQQELAQQNSALLRGVQRYLTHPYRRRESKADIRWQSGQCRLLDFGCEGIERARVLFIPSLINRYYILDLKDGRSMTDYLRANGIRPLVMDWGAPEGEECGFTLSDYLLHRMQPALQSARGDTPLILAGYCMGGLLALALAQQIRNLAGLALLATPWDFHSPQFPRVTLDNTRAERLRAVLARQRVIAGDIIQTLFYASNPWSFARKFGQFANIPSNSAEAEEFVSIESWVNDNVDMASPVAQECLLDWVQDNAPARGRWQAGGEIITPEAITLPVFAACPQHDSIVPPDCAEPLLPRLHAPEIIRPFSGHVGMVAGSQAERELWQPLHHWIERITRP